jgi:hypothetical protein
MAVQQRKVAAHKDEKIEAQVGKTWGRDRGNHSTLGQEAFVLAARKIVSERDAPWGVLSVRGTMTTYPPYVCCEKTKERKGERQKKRFSSWPGGKKKKELACVAAEEGASDLLISHRFTPVITFSHAQLESSCQ